MRTRLVATATATAIAGLAAACLLAGCGSDATDDSSPTTTTETAGATDTTGTTEGTVGTTDTTSTGSATVDANTATIEELTAAFEAAGIDQAERWAREVDEYRPYDTSDPTFASLRQELSKYNPSEEVLEAIIATLTL